MFSSGMLIFFMLGGALRSAGDARTPMVLGIAMTGAQHRAQRRADPRTGSDPGVRHGRRGDGHRASPRASSRPTRSSSSGAAGWVVSFPRGQGWGPDWTIIRVAVPVRPADGHPGHRDERRRRAACSRSSARWRRAPPAQAAFAVSYSQLFSLITWTSVGLMGAAAAVAGQNLGAGQPDRADGGGAHRRPDRRGRRGVRGAPLLLHSRASCSPSSA